MKEINYLDLSKKECISLGESDANEQIELASIDMLNEYLETQAKIHYLTSYLNTIHEEAMKDYEAYGEKEVVKYGRKIQVREVGVKYDFSNCNYPGFVDIEKSIKKDTDHLNEMKRTLKTITKKTVICDDETGETYEVKPPLKSSTTKLVIS